jgi:hypothetical protein
MRREIFLVTIRDVCVIWQVGLIQNGFINGNSIEISTSPGEGFQGRSLWIPYRGEILFWFEGFSVCDLICNFESRRKVEVLKLVLIKDAFWCDLI